MLGVRQGTADLDITIFNGLSYTPPCVIDSNADLCTVQIITIPLPLVPVLHPAVALPHRDSKASIPLPSIFPSHPVPFTMRQHPSFTLTNPQAHLDQHQNALIINPAEDQEEDTSFVISVCVEPDEGLPLLSASPLLHSNISTRQLSPWVAPFQSRPASCQTDLLTPVKSHNMHAMPNAFDSSRGPLQVGCWKGKGWFCGQLTCCRYFSEQFEPVPEVSIFKRLKVWTRSGSTDCQNTCAV